MDGNASTRTTEVDEATLAIDLAPGIGPVTARRLIEALGGASGVLNASAEQLQEHTGCSRARALTCRDAVARGLARVAAERVAVAEVGGRMISCTAPDYPFLLSVIPDPPLVLRVRGTLGSITGKRCRPPLAVVGSRRPTRYGRREAARFTAHFIERGFSIVSGGARGIDAIAHRTAVTRGGPTIAILGSGLGVPYPPEHRDLFDGIVANGGAVLSEYPVEAPPRPARFPRRNRLISGCSLGVLVIEAAARSGALITARQAVEDQGRELMVLPGRVDDPLSAGCLNMLREGWAAVVRSPEDAQATLEGASALCALNRVSAGS